MDHTETTGTAYPEDPDRPREWFAMCGTSGCSWTSDPTEVYEEAQSAAADHSARLDHNAEPFKAGLSIRPRRSI